MYRGRYGLDGHIRLSSSQREASSMVGFQVTFYVEKILLIVQAFYSLQK